MFLFPVDGILEVVLSYGQMISLFLVFVIFVFLLAVFVGVIFHDISFFVFMLIPVAMCLIAFFVARKTREKNIAKGIKYNKDGLIEEELKKMEKN